MRKNKKNRAFNPRQDPYSIGRLKIRLLRQFDGARDQRMVQSILLRWARLNRWIRKNANLSDFHLAAEQSNFDLCLQIHCQGKNIPNPYPQDCALGNWWIR